MAEFQNKVNGVTLKFTEPIDAAPPTDMYALYQFVPGTSEIGESKTLQSVDNKLSAFLVGSDDSICHVVLGQDVSRQHAVVQFRKRLIKVQNSKEMYGQEFTTRPYLMDLESRNGTELNGEPIEAARYYELRSGDLIKFGSLECVLMKK